MSERPSTYTSTLISHHAALDAVRAALEEGARRGLRVTVAVVDPSLQLMAFVRSNGTPADQEQVTRRKANTAAAMGRPTGQLPEDRRIALPMASGNVLTSLPGGYPIRFDGEVVGGIGIGGGTPEEDAEIAAAVTAALGADQ